jgi:hypothetical protein
MCVGVEVRATKFEPRFGAGGNLKTYRIHAPRMQEQGATKSLVDLAAKLLLFDVFPQAFRHFGWCNLSPNSEASNLRQALVNADSVSTEAVSTFL